MSTHRVDVIKIDKIHPHPNADKLEIIKINEYTCCVQKGIWKEGDLAAYVEPDYVVPTTHPRFEFLKREGRDKERVKVKKLRGIMSQGLLVPAPEGLIEGDNAMQALCIERYTPTIKGMSTKATGIKGPDGWYPKYDLENWRKYSRLLNDDEYVYVTEKIHGANAKFRFAEGKMWAGSRTRWVDIENKTDNPWAQALIQNPWIAAFCENHPEFTVYGEVFGWVQDLKYGAEKGEIFFRAFDLLEGNQWVDSKNIWKYRWLNFGPRQPEREIKHQIDEGERLAFVPLVFEGKYSKEKIREVVDGESFIWGADHIREGIVVKPALERQDMRLGRVALKIVSDAYLEKAK